MERRLYTRYACKGPVDCEMHLTDGEHGFIVDDISLTGMKLKTRDADIYDQVKVGDQIVVQTMSCEDTVCIRNIRGRVIWYAGSQEWVVLGVQFHTPLKHDLDILLLVDARSSRKGYPGSRAEN